MGKVTRKAIFTIFEKMGRLGFEPRTNRLKAECSTAELATRELISLLARLSNITQLFRLYKQFLKKNFKKNRLLRSIWGRTFLACDRWQQLWDNLSQK
jgi:hypothetical protein